MDDCSGSQHLHRLGLRSLASACSTGEGGSSLMLRAIAVAKKKNDRIDASKIADCLRCDFLPECHMAPTSIRDRRSHLALSASIGSADGADEESSFRLAVGNRCQSQQGASTPGE